MRQENPNKTSAPTRSNNRYTILRFFPTITRITRLRRDDPCR